MFNSSNNSVVSIRLVGEDLEALRLLADKGESIHAVAKRLLLSALMGDDGSSPSATTTTTTHIIDEVLSRLTAIENQLNNVSPVSSDGGDSCPPVGDDTLELIERFLDSIPVDRAGLSAREKLADKNAREYKKLADFIEFIKR